MRSWYQQPDSPRAEPTKFTRDDGRVLRIGNGFRERVLAAPRLSVRPKATWSDEDYSKAAEAKLWRSQSRLSTFLRWGVRLEDARVLEVGCGAGIDCLLMGLQPVRQVVGVDLRLPLFDASEEGERARRLTREAMQRLGLGSDIPELLIRLPVHFKIMDATTMAFSDNSFDLVWSRVALKEIKPFDRAFTEMARVLRPGGLMYHSIDPFFWLKGCYKGGLVDIPWAHARLSLEEFRRFVAESEGEAMAIKRSRHLTTLNRFTLRQWREIIDAEPFEVLEWKTERSPFAEMVLEEYPEVPESLLEGVDLPDLVHSSIRVWLRKKTDGDARTDRSRPCE